MSDYAIKYQHVERWDTDEVLYLKDCKELIVQLFMLFLAIIANIIITNTFKYFIFFIIFFNI